MWVDLDKLDFSERSPVQELDLQSKLALEGGITEIVNDQFADSGAMTVLSLKLLEEFAKKSGS